MICRVKSKSKTGCLSNIARYAPDVPRQIAPEQVASRFTVERDIRRACRHSVGLPTDMPKTWFVALAALSKSATPRRVLLNATADHVVVLPGRPTAKRTP
ncbi:hypothetical protein ACVWZZ_005760 [Bradyrhizobium sp. LM6.10]